MGLLTTRTRAIEKALEMTAFTDQKTKREENIKKMNKRNMKNEHKMCELILLRRENCKKQDSF